MIDMEKVIKGLELCGYEEGMPQCNKCPYDGKLCWKRLKQDALALLKEQEPREITKDEWKAWKKAKYRDPLCYVWVGDDTPCWVLKPEDIHEPAYLMGKIKILNTKPTDKLRKAVKWDG